MVVEVYASLRLGSAKGYTIYPIRNFARLNLYAEIKENIILAISSSNDWLVLETAYYKYPESFDSSLGVVRELFGCGACSVKESSKSSRTLLESAPKLSRTWPEGFSKATRTFPEALPNNPPFFPKRCRSAPEAQSKPTRRKTIFLQVLKSWIGYTPGFRLSKIVYTMQFNIPNWVIQVRFIFFDFLIMFDSLHLASNLVYFFSL